MDQLLAIRAFARVVEVGNFTKAADSLQLPKATVSKLVQTLEAHLGVQLLQRTTRRIVVTPDGSAYYEKSARVLKELEDIDASFSAAHARPRGHLRVDLGSSVASSLLVPALPDFLARYPDIRIDLGVSDRHVDLIGDNVDCVIRGGALTDPGLVARTIGRASWITCASPDYVKRHGKPKHPHDLEETHPVVNYLSALTGRPHPMHFENNGRRLQISARHAVGINESNAHFAAGLAGLGVIQTFAFIARDAVARGDLVEVLPRWRPKPYPLHLVYPPNRHLSQRLRVFIDWLADRFETQLEPKGSKS
ncbi:LysR family transcriptional regulator [Dyella subtropica]|uniref:LysR family transcriptional regulator n=1 Tax=Dyella subtropica TaxID=2992127 RepID=UPI00225AA7E9|nr:LysR family transcriptional regulator [Dyella subtropica]